MRPWAASLEADISTRFFRGRHGLAASGEEESDVDNDMAVRLAAAWDEGDDVPVGPLPPPVDWSLAKLLALPRAQRRPPDLSLEQLGRWTPEDPMSALRLLPAFHPRRIFTPAAQNLEPPSEELKRAFPHALRDDFRGGGVSDQAGTWRRMFPASRWASRVEGVGWVFDSKVDKFSDPNARFFERVDLDNHKSCDE